MNSLRLLKIIAISLLLVSISTLAIYMKLMNSLAQNGWIENGGIYFLAIWLLLFMESVVLIYSFYRRGLKTGMNLALTVAGILFAFLIGEADAALAASLFHFGELKIRDVKEYLKKSNIPVRN